MQKEKEGRGAPARPAEPLAVHAAPGAGPHPFALARHAPG